MGHRTLVICPFTQSIRLFSNVYAQALPAMENWDCCGKSSFSKKPSEFLASMFPMVVETTKSGQKSVVACLVWNTVKANRWAMLNSIGELGRKQVKRAEKLLVNFPESPLIHMMHHQVAVPQAPIKSKHPGLSKLALAHTIGMGLETAENFLRLLRGRVQRTCVLHGHHHKYFVATETGSGASVVSCPSSRFGTEVSYSSAIEAGKDVTWLSLKFVIEGVHLDLVGVNPM